MSWKSWYLVIINNLPHCIGIERSLWWHRDYRTYYCNLWCFITNQRLCRKPNRLANRQARQQIREYIDARAASGIDDEW